MRESLPGDLGSVTADTKGARGWLSWSAGAASVQTTGKLRQLYSRQPIAAAILFIASFSIVVGFAGVVLWWLDAHIGAVTAMLWISWRSGKPDPGMMANGMLAGLVAITAPCAFVAPWAAAVIGCIAPILTIEAVFIFERRFKIDDPVGAISVHGVCGLWGLLAVGLFARYDDVFLGREKAGLFYGGGFEQLGPELAPVALDQTLDAFDLRAVPGGAVAAVGEDADGQDTEASAHTVDADGAHGVVHLELALHEEHRLDDEHAGHATDHCGGPRRHKRARGGDGH